MEHIFLEKTYNYDIRNRKKGNLDGYKYDAKLGYWINNFMEPCINNKKFIKPQTKKEDIETGEDKKGE